MLDEETPRRAGTARRALLGTALLAGVALVASAWLSWRSAGEAFDALARGQGELFAETLRNAARGPAFRPEAGALAELLEPRRSEGLRRVALHGPAGRLVAETGPSGFGDGPSPRPGRLQLAPRARLVRLGVPLPPARGGPPPAGRDDGPARAPSGMLLVVEYEPTDALALRRRAAQTLAVSAAGALLLLLSALVFRRQDLRSERADALVQERLRLAELGELSAVLAHEIRNPLAVIQGRAELLVETTPPGDPARRKAERILDAARRLGALSNEMLDFVRAGEVQRSDVDPAELVRRAGEDVGYPVPVHAERAPERFRMDEGRMRQVLVNLLSNALEASPEGGIEARVEGDARRLRVRVRDRGPGLPPGDESKVFLPFRTGKARGTGLGLAISRRIVAQHGGTLTASNRPEGGAEFLIDIPSDRS